VAAMKLGRNDRVLVMCLGVFAGMVGLTYASVPLYRIFCQATGFDGTPRIYSQASTTLGDGTIEVRFDANVGQGLPWEFGPEQRSVKVRLGANNKIFYRAHNNSSEPVVGTATFNVTPEKAAQYFNKIQCFCFTKQVLKSGQSANLGVAFFVDPAIATDPLTKDVTAVTLSYTFFPAKSESKSVAQVTR
jgi:cytochrome c oxidase assembly protein subunit 11